MQGSAAAMVIRVVDKFSSPVSFVLSRLERMARAQEEQDRLGWRRQVEDFMTANGVRPVLEHLPESVWSAHYAANDDAYGAVLHELEHVAD